MGECISRFTKGSTSRDILLWSLGAQYCHNWHSDELEYEWIPKSAKLVRETIPRVFNGTVIWITPANTGNSKLNIFINLTAEAFKSWPGLWYVDMAAGTASQDVVRRYYAKNDAIHHNGNLSTVPWHFIMHGLGCDAAL